MQRERILPLHSELGLYVDESMARFVLGQRDMTDEAKAEFRAGLAERGAEKFTQEWQSILGGMNQ